MKKFDKLELEFIVFGVNVILGGSDNKIREDLKRVIDECNNIEEWISSDSPDIFLMNKLFISAAENITNYENEYFLKYFNSSFNGRYHGGIENLERFISSISDKFRDNIYQTKYYQGFAHFYDTVQGVDLSSIPIDKIKINIPIAKLLSEEMRMMDGFEYEISPIHKLCLKTAKSTIY